MTEPTDTDATDTDGTRPSALSRALDGVLRPLVRVLIAQGLTAPALYRRLKRIYVEVAEADFRLDDQRPTDSRISVLTGVHRRDVKALREEGGGERPGGERVTTLGIVIGTWLASEATTDPGGAPLPLPRAADDGPSFDALVSSVSQDIRPRTVLDELMRQGLVAEMDDGRIALVPDAFLGPGDLDQKLRFFGENVGDHIAAAVDNLLTEHPKFLERAVFYNNLSPGSIQKIDAEARQAGNEALIRVNRLANTLQSEDGEAPGSTQRFRFGLFFYQDDEAPTEIGGSKTRGEQGDEGV